MGILAIAAAASILNACGLFGSNSVYTRAVSTASVDEDSSRYIQAMMQAGSTGGFWIAADPVEFVNVATGRTPTLRVRQRVPYHRFPTAYPWQADFRIEPLSDAHAIVVRTDDCRLFESYNTTYADGVLSAYSGAIWSLGTPFVPLPGGEPSAMASGLSLYAGMVRPEEVASGAIRHALNWAAPAGTVAQWKFVRPASDAEGIPFKGSSAYTLPYGAHLRLRASFDTSRFGPQSAAIAQAMKTYGIYLADTARENELYDASPLSDGPNPWNAPDLAALAAIHVSDLEVLSLGRSERVPGR